ncbi:hypothetical protein TraAM80_03281, partial [Trypanosoma rangeli]
MQPHILTDPLSPLSVAAASVCLWLPAPVCIPDPSVCVPGEQLTWCISSLAPCLLLKVKEDLRPHLPPRPSEVRSVGAVTAVLVLLLLLRPSVWVAGQEEGDAELRQLKQSKKQGEKNKKRDRTVYG